MWLRELRELPVGRGGFGNRSTILPSFCTPTIAIPGEKHEMPQLP